MFQVVYPANRGRATYMSSLEATLDARPEAAPEPIVGPLPEKPVFAATSSTRPRALKLLGRVAAGLVGLWLVALVLGALGLGQVAGITLPTIGGGSSHPSQKQTTINKERDAPAPHASAASLTARGPAGRRTAQQQDAMPANTTAGHGGAGSHAGTRRGGSRGPGAHGGSGSSQQPAAGTQLGTYTPSSSSPGASSSAPGHTGSTPSSSGTTSAPSSSPSTHASPHATPPGSSSAAPGSRSQAGTAPGRDNSSANPTPGSGSTDHGRPTG